MSVVILDFLANIVISAINFLGYGGIFLMMFLESCGIPMPSEVIMPFSGSLVVAGHLSFWSIVIVGALGNLAGSWLAYWIGYRGGRPLIEKYGKYILISKHDLDLADNWFKKYGDWAVFFGRLLPVIRTYISFPAGISKMNFKRFSAFTLLGALPWTALFTYLGEKMWQNWDPIRAMMHRFDYFIVGLIVVALILYILRHLKHARNER